MFANSQSYERFMGRWSRKLAEPFLDFVGLGPACNVLDVGCGTGALTEAILRRHPHNTAVGVDPSPDFLEEARSRIDGERARFEVVDARSIPEPDASFDAALSMLALNFVPEPMAAVREMSRVTKQGGSVGGVLWDISDGMLMLRRFWDAAVEIDPAADSLDERHHALCVENRLMELFQSAGLLGVVGSKLTVPMQFESFDDYWQPFLGGQGPAGAFVQSLANEDREKLRELLRSRLSPGDQKFDLSATAWAVKAVVG
jgi:SAM-dependent methyltransferase